MKKLILFAIAMVLGCGVYALADDAQYGGNAGTQAAPQAQPAANADANGVVVKKAKKEAEDHDKDDAKAAPAADQGKQTNPQQ